MNDSGTDIRSLLHCQAPDTFSGGSSSPVRPRFHASVRRHLGRPTIFLNEEPIPLAMYSAPGGSPSFLPFKYRALSRFLDQDLAVHIVHIPGTRSDHGVSPTENFWQGDTISAEPLVQSCDEIDAEALAVLKRKPDMPLIIRFSLRLNADWLKAHPEERFVREDGRPLEVLSMASRDGCKMLARYSAALMSYCLSRPWADRIAGFCVFPSGEGAHRPLLSGHWLYDHGAPMQRRWREFLRERYQTEEAMREAYDQGLDFDSLPVPKDPLNGSRREVAALPYWQDAGSNRSLRDYLDLVRQLYFENFRMICEACRSVAGPDRILLHDTFKIPMQGWSTGAFFRADNPELGHWPMQYAEVLAGSGNVGLKELAGIPGMDGLVTPHDYQVRGVGGVLEPEGSADSMVLRGKLFFVEWDLRTFAAEGCRSFGSAQTLQEYRAVTWRDLASALTRGFAAYFCDHNADYHALPEMHETISQQIEVIRKSHQWPHRTMPGIAMVLDEEAAWETSGSGHVFNEAIMWELKTGLPRCGVPHRVYVLDDLELAEFPPHRVFYFPNLYRVDQRRLELLREKVFRDGNVVVFGPGSGISDGTCIDAESASRLTGFEFRLRKNNSPRRVQIVDFRHPITRDLREDACFGSAVAYGPQLYPTNGTSLGRAWTQQGDADTGLAVRSFGRGARGEVDRPQGLGAGDYAAVFCTAAPIPADLWRGLARFAGAHVYNESNDVLLASEGLVAIHALKPGPRTLVLPGPCRVMDLIQNQRISETTDRLHLEIEPPATHFFRVTPVDEKKFAHPAGKGLANPFNL